jgi:hypothetical protein
MAPPRTLGYRCRTCKRTSTSADDIGDQYCGHCHTRHTGDIVVATWDDPWDPGTPPILKPPRIGCSTVAHTKLGWCCKCPDVCAVAEVMAWRCYAMGDVVIPGYTGAQAMTRQLDARGNR